MSREQNSILYNEGSCSGLIQRGAGEDVTENKLSQVGRIITSSVEKASLCVILRTVANNQHIYRDVNLNRIKPHFPQD